MRLPFWCAAPNPMILGPAALGWVTSRVLSCPPAWLFSRSLFDSIARRCKLSIRSACRGGTPFSIRSRRNKPDFPALLDLPLAGPKRGAHILDVPGQTGGNAMTSQPRETSRGVRHMRHRFPPLTPTSVPGPKCPSTGTDSVTLGNDSRGIRTPEPQGINTLCVRRGDGTLRGSSLDKHPASSTQTPPTTHLPWCLHPLAPTCDDHQGRIVQGMPDARVKGSLVRPRLGVLPAATTASSSAAREDEPYSYHTLFNQSIFTNRTFFTLRSPLLLCDGTAGSLPARYLSIPGAKSSLKGGVDI
ncbi:hypothetical protein B0T11DRAFT_14021 [Plectosphaerella cucumerina]|jgi:hypothetical protein|uniref:Uncharacterized protein n=1 Tax=Plectosphaerella cucumerina TaxID=40658 RepID=A0A8K0TTT7_9PEZI|nr:hypothetical protein B0T11DRAFT_14021 [Plectosphaerella cucumerina]